MSTITLPNIRVSSDLTVKLKLKDGGVALDWSTLQNIKVSIYSDAQRALAGRCGASIDAEDPTLLVCTYAANKPQYVGVNRVVVSAKYMGETKTYDKPAFNFVRWTDDQAGEQITIDDPDIDVEIEVEDVSSSILQAAIAAALQAAEDAEHAAHLVPLEVLQDCEQATQDANEAAAAANAAGITSVQVSVEDNEPGTPSAECSLANKVLSVIFHYLKGETGDAAGFGTITATCVEDGGDPSVLVTLSGPDTAKNIAFTLKNFKGDKGDKGDQGNTGSSVDYPFEIVNNCTTDDATKALSAAQGKALKDEVSQLEAKVTELADGGEPAPTIGMSNFSLDGIYKTTDDTIGTNANYKSTPLVPVTPGTVLKWSGFPVANDVSFAACFYDANNAPVAVGSNNRLSYGTIKSTLSFTIPSGVSQVGFTWNNGVYPLTSACVIKIGDITPVTLKDAVVEDVGERLGIQDINESIQDINESIQDINFVQKNGIALGTTEDGPIDVDGGLTSTISSYKRCIIPNAGYVRISGHGSSYAPRPVLAFYNSATPGASSFISGIASTVNYEDKDFDVQIPDGTVTIIVSWSVDDRATAGVANLYTTQEKVDALSDSVDALVENVRPITVTPADFTATGLWKADIGEIDATKTNYSAIPQLLDVIEGQTIKFHNWQKNYSDLDSVAAIFCYDNDGLPFNGSSARKNYGDLTTFNYETGEYTFVIPSNCSYVGLAFNFVTIPLSGGGSSIEVREGDIALTDKAKELINNAVETGEQVGGDSAKYYLKGNSNIVYSSAKKLGIIAAGQSNIDGRNSYSDLPAGFVNPNAKVRFCNNVNGTFSDFQVTDGGANNDWSFDAIVYDLLTKSAYGNQSEIYVMKKSVGGTSIDQMGATSQHWTADYEFLETPSASLLRTFETIVRKGVELQGANFDIKAMLWHQGEGDMQNEAVANRYYENLKNMLAYVRGVVGNPRLYFFCGNISLNRTSPGYVNIINAAYTKLASEDPYFKVVDMSNAQLEDGYHFNYQWSIYFGQKVYDLMIDAGIITGTKINPSEPS